MARRHGFRYREKSSCGDCTETILDATSASTYTSSSGLGLDRKCCSLGPGYGLERWSDGVSR
jgi:hypothetical protein